MRTFIAIDLSEENKRFLTDIQTELRDANTDVKWVKSENIHLTLKFLGDVTEQQANQVSGILDKIAAGFQPFEISLSGIGAFPKLEYPRVIWVGVNDKGCRGTARRAPTVELAQVIKTELEKFGFVKEERPFAAHLTIGRVRTPKNKEQLITVIKDRNNKGRPQGAAPTSQFVSCIKLYQSILTSKGPIYSVLHRALLK